jgi:hypothetical protein
MIKQIMPRLVLILAMACTVPVLAATDPTLPQVYEAARTGHLAQAQQMMDQVLRDHPNSAKAHYVAAEIYAREGNASRARQELSTAERLAPGLPFAKPEAVQALQREVSQGGQSARMLPVSSQAHSSFPWGMVLMVVGGVVVVWLIARRRSAPANVYPQYSGQAPAGAGAGGVPGSFGGPGMGGGVGSGIAGGLASGLAVGAGVVAGEELAHHFLDGRREGNVPPASNETAGPSENNDLGGSDFGVSDASSWDDSAGSGGGDVGGGGDDWT